MIAAKLYLSVNKLTLKDVTMIPSCIQNYPVRYALAFVFVFVLVYVIFTVLALVWKLAGLRWSTSSAFLCSAFVFVFILVVFVFVFFFVFVIALS